MHSFQCPSTFNSFQPILLINFRKMRRSESAEEVRGDASLGDRSFSSLPVPTTTTATGARPWWREDALGADSKANHSISLPHLLVLEGKHSVSLPHLLAIETYYNYPSAASILDETFHDVVDQSKIQAEVAQEKSPANPKPPRRPRSLKRTLSLKSLRRFRTRILHLLTFRKQRRERSGGGETNNRTTFDLYELPMETRQQLKQIYVYWELKGWPGQRAVFPTFLSLKWHGTPKLCLRFMIMIIYFFGNQPSLFLILILWNPE